MKRILIVSIISLLFIGGCQQSNTEEITNLKLEIDNLQDTVDDLEEEILVLEGEKQELSDEKIEILEGLNKLSSIITTHNRNHFQLYHRVEIKYPYVYLIYTEYLEAASEWRAGDMYHLIRTHVDGSSFDLYQFRYNLDFMVAPNNKKIALDINDVFARDDNLNFLVFINNEGEELKRFKMNDFTDSKDYFCGILLREWVTEDIFVVELCAGLAEGPFYQVNTTNWEVTKYEK